MFSSNEARPHLLADHSGKAGDTVLVRVIVSLAEVVRHEAFTQTQQATASSFHLR